MVRRACLETKGSGDGTQSNPERGAHANPDREFLRVSGKDHPEDGANNHTKAGTHTDRDCDTSRCCILVWALTVQLHLSPA